MKLTATGEQHHVGCRQANTVQQKHGLHRMDFAKTNRNRFGKTAQSSYNPKNVLPFKGEETLALLHVVHRQSSRQIDPRSISELR